MALTFDSSVKELLANPTAVEICKKIIDLEGKHIHALFADIDTDQINSANGVLSDLIEKLTGQT